MGFSSQALGPSRAHRDVPARATAVQATLAVALALSGTFDQIISYMMVPTLVFLVLTICGIFILERRRSPGEPSMAPAGYPLSPLLFLIPIAGRDSLADRARSGALVNWAPGRVAWYSLCELRFNTSPIGGRERS